MRKHFLLGLIMSLTFSAFAQEQQQPENSVTPPLPDDLIVIGKKMEWVEEILNSIEGYVFLEKGEQNARDLTDTFYRSSKLFKDKEKPELQAMKWKVINEEMVNITEDGKVEGKAYGETIMTVTDELDVDEEGNPKEHNFIVFVCPTVTVISPDGSIYTHQKIYDKQMKVDFSHSQNYTINSVMAKYYGNETEPTKIYDITDKINKVTGHYVSDIDIQGDVEYTVTLEENPGDNLRSNSKVRLCVVDGIMELKSTEKEPLNMDTLNNMRIDVSTVKKQNGEITETAIATFEGGNCINVVEGSGEEPDKVILNIPFNDGIYFIKFYYNNKLEYNFKVVIKYPNQI